MSTLARRGTDVRVQIDDVNMLDFDSPISLSENTSTVIRINIAQFQPMYNCVGCVESNRILSILQGCAVEISRGCPL